MIFDAILGLPSARADVTWKQIEDREAADILSGYAIGTSTATGETVTPDGAMSVGAYYACISAIAGDVGKLPFKTYRRRADGGKDLADTHPLYHILHDQSGPGTTALTFREAVTGHACGWGNGYAEIERDGRADVTALHLIHPSRVTPRVRGSTVVYEVRNNDGGVTEIDGSKMLHIRGFGDGLVGWSPARLMAEDLGITIAARKYGGAFFKNAVRPAGVIEHPGSMGDRAYKRLKETWAEEWGGTANVGKSPILEEDAKWRKITIPPNEAQFVETRKFEVVEICRYFQVPPWRVGHNEQAKGWGTWEATILGYLQFCLHRWLVMWEQEVKLKLLGGPQSQYFAEHVVDGLLRMDAKSRGALYQFLLRMGYSPNELRAMENRNPIPEEEGGDKRFISANLKPLDAPAEAPAETLKLGGRGQSARPPGATDDGKDGKEDGNDPGGGKAAALMPVFRDAAERLIRKETRAVAAAAKRLFGPALDQWLVGFFKPEHVRATFAAPLQSAAALGFAINEDVAFAVCERHVAAALTMYRDTPMADALAARTAHAVTPLAISLLFAQKGTPDA